MGYDYSFRTCPAEIGFTITCKRNFGMAVKLINCCTSVQFEQLQPNLNRTKFDFRNLILKIAFVLIRSISISRLFYFGYARFGSNHDLESGESPHAWSGSAEAESQQNLRVACKHLAYPLVPIILVVNFDIQDTPEMKLCRSSI